MIPYKFPSHWAKYDTHAVSEALAQAKAAVLSLKTMPYQRSWVEHLQRIELKMEVAGTSRIEGAEFTERELDAALSETRDQLVTRSQRQVFAALKTYEWLATLPDDRPVTTDLIRDIHRLIVTGADDDHCPPGELRGKDQNVTFGTPRHRGCDGGPACADAFARLAHEVRSAWGEHDQIVAALVAHYHLAAMHPFLDGNGRTARALEALLLQRAGLRDTCFIAMSNYYYDEKARYLAALAEVRARDHDLTPFLLFGLEGIRRQVTRLLVEIQYEMKKALFVNMMYSLFPRQKSRRKQVIAKRQIQLLHVLLESRSPVRLSALQKATAQFYARLQKPHHALARDLNNLLRLKAIAFERQEETYYLSVRLEWPTEITETEFFRQIREMPKAKEYAFLE